MSPKDLGYQNTIIDLYCETLHSVSCKFLSWISCLQFYGVKETAFVIIETALTITTLNDYNISNFVNRNTFFASCLHGCILMRYIIKKTITTQNIPRKWTTMNPMNHVFWKNWPIIFVAITIGSLF